MVRVLRDATGGVFAAAKADILLGEKIAPAKTAVRKRKDVSFQSPRDETGLEMQLRMLEDRQRFGAVQTNGAAGHLARSR